MIGGMPQQQPDFIYLIELAPPARQAGMCRWPDVSSAPHLYADADFQVIGEASISWCISSRAWESGERKGVFIAEKFKIDVTQSPMPRYDLIKFDHYFYIGVLYSRGCHVHLRFCDIIELYGRVAAGPRPTIRFWPSCQRFTITVIAGMSISSDDNLSVNRKPPTCCRSSKRGRRTHYPFEFSTEASINIGTTTVVAGDEGSELSGFSSASRARIQRRSCR